MGRARGDDVTGHLVKAMRAVGNTARRGSGIGSSPGLADERARACGSGKRRQLAGTRSFGSLGASAFS